MADDKKNLNRREFLHTAGRGAALVAMAAVAWVLGRRQGSGLGGQDCTGGGICRGCESLSACGLPAALSMKKAVGGKKAEDRRL